jgi:hypothetical protein
VRTKDHIRLALEGRLLLGETLLRLRHRHPEQRMAGASVRATLGELFPLAPENVRSELARRALSVTLQAVAVCAGAVVLLTRIPGVPAWDCIYAEDYGVFLVQALQHPWHLLVPYNGYLQLVPRIIGQFVSLLPLTAAAAAFAVTGALIASGCALFIWHASAGFIRSGVLRAVLGAALVLLPVAPLEVADSGVNSPWYIMVALFWAVLWRPQTLAGMAVAATIAFAATSSVPVAIVYAPLLIIRVFTLPRLREHAVTAGWLAGWVVQVPVILHTYTNHKQRLGTSAPLGKAVAYYFHTVVLRALGWHLSWRLESVAGQTGATLIVGAFLAVVLGWAVITQGRKVRVFVVTAVLAGFVYTVFAAAITNYVVRQAPLLSPVSFEPASRYSVLPIVLLDAAAIVAVDAFIRRRDTAVGPAAVRTAVRPPQAIFAVAALGCVLAFGWVTDYRYVTQRTTNGHWTPVAVSMLSTCSHSRTGKISLPAWGQHKVSVPCSRLHR